MVDGDKREMLAERAESLLLCLKQRFPSLPQTTLDTSKIQCNKVQFLSSSINLLLILLHLVFHTLNVNFTGCGKINS